MQDKDVVTTDD